MYTKSAGIYTDGVDEMLPYQRKFSKVFVSDPDEDRKAKFKTYVKDFLANLAGLDEGMRKYVWFPTDGSDGTSCA